MLSIPAAIEEQFADHAMGFQEASVICYKADLCMMSTPVLVTQPTFVLVCGGVKQLKPQDGAAYLVAPTRTVVVMRSGTHLMSEFHGEETPYHSIVFSVNRTFLREAVGVPEQASKGARVVVSMPSEHAQRLFYSLPDAVAKPLSKIERQFKFRELLIALMGDKAVRELVLRETADWGHTEAERIISVITDHYLSPLQVPDFAKLCAMSLSSFKRHFHAVYSTPPAKWLTKQRLEYARTLIVNSDRPVVEICHASGYRDVSSFVRAFRRNFGCTPTALRFTAIRLQQPQS